MLRTILLLTVAVMTAPDLAGQCVGTVVGGPITAPTTWTAAGSPYCVTSSVLVTANATLTIAPGVTVVFDAGSIITVGNVGLGAGTLVARGTAAQPIRFTGQAGTPGSWNALHFTDGAVDAAFNMSGSYVSGSILEHCVVEFAGAGPTAAAVRLEQASPLIRSCTIRSCAKDGINASMGPGANGPTPPLRVERCTIEQNGGSGIVVSQGSGHVIDTTTVSGNNPSNAAISISASNATVAACAVLDNASARGVSVTGSGASITDCRIERNGGGIWLSSSNASVARNRIRENTTTSGGGGLYLIYSSAASLTDNVIANNTGTGRGGGLYSFASTLTLSRDTIANNTATDGAGLYLGQGNTAMTDCSVNGNTATNRGGGLYCANGAVMTGTTIACNDANEGGGLYVAAAGVSLAGTSGGPHNTFLANTATTGAAIYNNNAFATNGTGDVPASFVRWGPTSSRALGRIHDYFVAPSRGIVLDGSPIASGPFADLGAAVGSPAGTPALGATGPLTPGSALTVSIFGARAQTGAVLLFDITAPYSFVPLLNAVVVPGLGPTSAFALLQTDAMGSASLTVPSLAWIPPGFRLFLQAVVVDPTAPNGLATLSNGLVGKS